MYSIKKVVAFLKFINLMMLSISAVLGVIGVLLLIPIAEVPKDVTTLDNIDDATALAQTSNAVVPYEETAASIGFGFRSFLMAFNGFCAVTAISVFTLMYFKFPSVDDSDIDDGVVLVF